MTLDPVVQQSSTGIDATPAHQMLTKKKVSVLKSGRTAYCICVQVWAEIRLLNTFKE